MFVGFNLKTDYSFENFVDAGKQIFNNCKEEITSDIEKFIDSDGSINGTKMQSNWFPQIDADVFISHSHKDESIALGLAGWLKQRFGLNAFIDSCVWGYSLELLRKIDNKYSINPNKETYDYDKRNYSTSHVNMMLATALTMMIDKTECIFFLNTPESINTNDIQDKTISPWIYHEIAMTNLIKKKNINEHRKNLIKQAFKESKQELIINYDVSLSHLHDINDDDLNSWREKSSILENSLDTLYKIKNLISEKDFTIING